MDRASPALWRLDSRARRVFALRVLQESTNDEDYERYLDEVVRYDTGSSRPVLAAGSIWMPSLYAGLFDEEELLEVLKGEEAILSFLVKELVTF